MSSNYKISPPPRKAHLADQRNAEIFYRAYDQGRIKIGCWVRIDLDFHVNSGFAGIVVGYDDDYLVNVSDGNIVTHASPKFLTSITPKQGMEIALAQQNRVDSRSR